MTWGWPRWSPPWPRAASSGPSHSPLLSATRRTNLTALGLSVITLAYRFHRMMTSPSRSLSLTRSDREPSGGGSSLCLGEHVSMVDVDDRRDGRCGDPRRSHRRPPDAPYPPEAAAWDL